jgi:hypothetical protein
MSTDYRCKACWRTVTDAGRDEQGKRRCNAPGTRFHVAAPDDRGATDPDQRATHCPCGSPRCSFSLTYCYACVVLISSRALVTA